MRILAVTPSHNSTVAFIEDGEILDVISEEKFTNVKNSTRFPLRSIQWILNQHKLSIAAIDRLVVGQRMIWVLGPDDEGTQYMGHCGQAKQGLFRRLYEEIDFRWGTSPPIGSVIQAINQFTFERNALKSQAGFTELCVRHLGIPAGKIRYLEHHDCHCFASYYGLRPVGDGSPALILSIDGIGDLFCSQISTVQKGTWELVARSFWKHSPGGLYARTTAILGMKMLEHEYKVMGLAAYSTDPKYFKPTKARMFDGLIGLDETGLEFRAKHPTHLIEKHLRKTIPYERFDNVAAALQTTTEELVEQWVRNAIAKTGIRNIYTTGGLFMNVKLNKKLQEMPEVERIHFLPSCGDESLPIGAAYKDYLDATGQEPHPLKNLYLGTRYTRPDIEAFFEEKQVPKKYTISTPPSPNAHVAQLLANGKVIARFCGRGEWGARGLGNRSILARPDRLESFFEVNDRVKMRDFWMPFAPTILDTYADRYLVNPRAVNAPYMITAFDSTVEGRDKFRAAIHQRDKTLRAQILRREHNPEYYDLIEQFAAITGIGGVLNTSFNLHGYPLVSSLEQALFTIEGCYLDYLQIEDFLLEKKSQIRTE